jgi:hypothetical protein
VTRERTKNIETASSWHSTNHSGEGLTEKDETIRQQEREKSISMAMEYKERELRQRVAEISD